MHDYKKTGAKKAFTLIELLVVIAIIAMLMAIMVPSLRKVRENARRVVCKSNLKQAAVAATTYAAGNNGRFIVRDWSGINYGDGCDTAHGSPTYPRCLGSQKTIECGYNDLREMFVNTMSGFDPQKSHPGLYCPSASVKVDKKRGPSFYATYEMLSPWWEDDTYTNITPFEGAYYHIGYNYWGVGKTTVSLKDAYDGRTGGYFWLSSVKSPSSMNDSGSTGLFSDAMLWVDRPIVISKPPGFYEFMWRLGTHFKAGAKVLLYEGEDPDGGSTAFLDGSVRWGELRKNKTDVFDWGDLEAPFGSCISKPWVERSRWLSLWVKPGGRSTVRVVAPPNGD